MDNKMQFVKALGLNWTRYKRLDPQVYEEFEMLRGMNAVIHAHQCKEVNCELFWCEKLKRAITHSKYCKTSTTGAVLCRLCKELVFYTVWHANSCVVPECQVPFCEEIKMMIEQQQQSQSQQVDKNGSGPSKPEPEAGASSSSSAPAQQRQNSTATATAGAPAPFQECRWELVKHEWGFFVLY